jgi:hypothetical protein
MMSATPVPSSFNRSTLRRVVDEKLQQFLRAASVTSPPRGGDRTNSDFRLVNHVFGLLVKDGSELYSVRRNEDIRVGELTAMCYVNTQGFIHLRFCYRTTGMLWYSYEFVLCYQGRSRTSTKWVDVMTFYGALVEEERAAEASPPAVNMAFARSSAEDLLTDIKARRRVPRFKGAQLTSTEVESQIRSLRGVKFVIGGDTATLSVGSYKAVCFEDSKVLKLRVFRYGSDGWLHATFVLEVRPARPRPSPHVRSAATSQYHWKQ